uniref:PDZ domain-containing protein n=1 Tax=Caenorhabditis tropicalis TaxID=1561998 RepID=A0A1I7T7V6_9PELO
MLELSENEEDTAKTMTIQMPDASDQPTSGKETSGKKKRGKEKGGKAFVPLNIPEFHFSSVQVTVTEGNWDIIRNLFDGKDGKEQKLLNKNMVLIMVPMELMTDFISGDQITRVNGKIVWNWDDMKEALFSQDQGSITVTRPWNVKCPTKEQLESVSPVRENCQYFVVKCQGIVDEETGMKLISAKNRILVKKIYVNSIISYALLIGDQILGVNNQILNGTRKSIRLKVFEWIKESCSKIGSADIFACRPVGARSSPVPSLEAEQVRGCPTFAAARKPDERKDGMHLLLDLPVPSDALEIAFRELTFLKEIGFKDSNDFCQKRGPSLLENVEDSLVVSPTAKTPLIGKLKQNFSTVESKPAILGNPKDIKQEISTITSDIQEEDNLKKCDRNSGMVAFMKAKIKTPAVLPKK